VGSISGYLNQHGPSCDHGKDPGDNQQYKKYESGDGVTMALLKRNGIKVFTERNLKNFKMNL